MVSTGWRTACAVIVILVGAALLTFGIFIWRRQKTLRRAAAPRPEMQQRFMSSYAFDPEAHTPLLYSEATPPLPPKTQSTTSQADRSADVDEWGFKLRTPPARVPVPPMYFPEPTPAPAEGAVGSRSDPAAASIPIPEPSIVHKLFPTPSILQFPKIQFSRDGNTRLGRLPSLRIQFLRESNQVISSPLDVAAFPEHDRRISLPQSTTSRPSTLSRPFATAACSPLPPMAPISPISISVQSQTETSGAPSTARSDSVASVGHHLFARKASAEDCDAGTGISRASSQQSRALARGNGSASSSSGGLSRAETAWSPNVMASYSPWKGVVHGDWAGAEGAEGAEAGPSRAHVESPEGHLRVADAWRPMPTLSENPAESFVVEASIPRRLPELPPGVEPVPCPPCPLLSPPLPELSAVPPPPLLPEQSESASPGPPPFPEPSESPDPLPPLLPPPPISAPPPSFPEPQTSASSPPPEVSSTSAASPPPPPPPP